MKKESLFQEQFVMLTHRIKTQVNAIIDFADLLIKDHTEKQRQSPYRKQIQQVSDNLLRQISEITSYCENGIETKTVLRLFDINNTIDNLFDLYAPRVINKGLRFSCYKDPRASNTLLCSNEKRVKLIMESLLDNALEYTKRGEIEFGYYISRTKFLFFVRDTGIGIRETQTSKIFNMFYRSPEVQKNGFKGAGLGLTIATHAAKAIGTSVKVSSIIGKGSFFWFNL